MIKSIQAHRGFSDVYPENTLLAFSEAVKAGAGAVEMDVRRTADGAFILMHDYSVDRTTNGSGYIEQLRCDDLRMLDAGAWKGERFAGRADTRIPTLEQVLDEFQGSVVTVVLHLKEHSVKVLQAVKRRGMLEQVVFFGGMSVINSIKQLDKNAFTQNDGAPGPDTYEPVLANAVQYGHNAVSVNPATITAEMVERIKENGLRVHCSFLTADYEAETARLFGMGVDYVLGNDPERMVRAANKEMEA